MFNTKLHLVVRIHFWRSVKNSFIAITPKTTLIQVGCTFRMIQSENTDCNSAGDKTLPTVSWYDTKQSVRESPVMLELWRMRSTPSLPSLPGLPWPGVVAPDRVLFMVRLEVDYLIKLNWIVWILLLDLTVCKRKIILIQNWIVWNRTVFNI